MKKISLVQIILGILILIGLGLLLTQKYWVSGVVSSILAREESQKILPIEDVSTLPTQNKATATQVNSNPTETKPKGFHTGNVKGRVLLSPVCPVERNPPDPTCIPRGYQKTVRIEGASSSNFSKEIESDTDGSFTVSLETGTYMFSVVSKNLVFPKCFAAEVLVVKNETQNIILECDTGIR